jgi:hypothetical protein
MTFWYPPYERRLLCSFEGPRGLSPFSGGYGEGETPLPIPNREVKPLSADGTWPARARESRTPPVLSSMGRPPGGPSYVLGASDRSAGASASDSARSRGKGRGARCGPGGDHPGAAHSARVGNQAPVRMGRRLRCSGDGIVVGAARAGARDVLEEREGLHERCDAMQPRGPAGKVGGEHKFAS